MPNHKSNTDAKDKRKRLNESLKKVFHFKSPTRAFRTLIIPAPPHNYPDSQVNA